MNKGSDKKVVLFLVEGLSERHALEPKVLELFDRVDETIEVFFHGEIGDEDTGGDIATKSDVCQNNIEDKIYEFMIYKFLDNNKILPEDIRRIIHIVDVDGVYIADDQVNRDDSKRLFYALDGIYTKNVDKIIERNIMKKQNLDYLITLKEIKVQKFSVPYSVYFFFKSGSFFVLRR